MPASAAYIDTSVLVAYYCPEELSSVAEKAITSAQKPLISALVEVELHSAISLKVRMGQLTPTDGGAVLATFHVHRSQGLYTLLPVGDAQFALAREWLGRFTTQLRTVDALHLATSFSSGAPLLTADRLLADAAKSLKVPCRMLRPR